MTTAIVGLTYLLAILYRQQIREHLYEYWCACMIVFVLIIPEYTRITRAWWASKNKYDRSTVRFWAFMAVAIPVWLFCGIAVIIMSARY